MTISLSHKRLASLMLVVFLCNLLLPYFAANPLAADNRSSDLAADITGTDRTNDKILLCTAKGFRWVSVAELDSFAGSVDNDLYDCPLCYLSAHGLQALAASDSFFLSRPAQPIYLTERQDDFPTEKVLSRGILTRGPPLTA